MPEFIRLAHKPSAELAYTFTPSHGPAPKCFIIFLNGLGLPASAWEPTISLISSKLVHPALLSYDRYGHGASIDRDPQDAYAEDPKHGHDCMDAVTDLHQLISQIAEIKSLNGAEANLFFVCNSIGCALARLYAVTYPGTVSALLLLDSVMANSDFVSIWPDPDAADFAEKASPLPEGVTVELLRETRKKYGHVFHPVNGTMGNAEGLTRRNLIDLLPHAGKPKLVGQDGEGPWLTVVGHGFQKFAEEGLMGPMKTPLALTNNYTNPVWHRYNEELATLTSAGRSKGPIQAANCGHFIQKDDPNFVVGEINEILEKLE